LRIHNSVLAACADLVKVFITLADDGFPNEKLCSDCCYCIEIGVPQQTGDSYTKKGEDFWDNYPSSYNSTISPDDIKLFIGRIFQYGYTGTISTSWRSQNEGGDKLAHAVATQLLIWETVIGERDENFTRSAQAARTLFWIRSALTTLFMTKL